MAQILLMPSPFLHRLLNVYFGIIRNHGMARETEIFHEPVHALNAHSKHAGSGWSKESGIPSVSPTWLAAPSTDVITYCTPGRMSWMLDQRPSSWDSNQQSNTRREQPKGKLTLLFLNNHLKRDFEQNETELCTWKNVRIEPKTMTISLRKRQKIRKECFCQN